MKRVSGKERVKLIKRLLDGGHNMAEIGDRLGLTRERIRQIRNEENLPGRRRKFAADVDYLEEFPYCVLNNLEVSILERTSQHIIARARSMRGLPVPHSFPFIRRVRKRAAVSLRKRGLSFHDISEVMECEHGNLSVSAAQASRWYSECVDYERSRTRRGVDLKPGNLINSNRDLYDAIQGLVKSAD